MLPRLLDPSIYQAILYAVAFPNVLSASLSLSLPLSLPLSLSLPLYLPLPPSPLSLSLSHSHLLVYEFIIDFEASK